MSTPTMIAIACMIVMVLVVEFAPGVASCLCSKFVEAL